MPSTKKPASSKRAAFPREASYEKRFVKDWERLSRSGRYNMKQLKEAMMMLIANDAPLGPEWLDHPLKGSVAKIVKLEHAWRRLDGRNDDGFQVAPFPG